MWESKPLALNLQPDPWVQLDGRLNAPVGAPQLPTLLNGYPTGAPPNARTRWPNNGTQPPWYVAGVDYKVGIPAGTALVDWQTIDGSTGSNPIPGVTVSGHNVTVADGTTINNVDFSLHNGAFLNIVANNNITVRRCKFGWGLNFMSSSGPSSSLVNFSGSNITFEYNEVYGNSSLFTSTVTATGTIASGNTVFSNIFPIPSWFANAIDISIFDVTSGLFLFNGPNGDNSTGISSFTGSSVTVGSSSVNAITSGDTLIISGVPHQTTLVSCQFSGGIQGPATSRYNYFTDMAQHVVELASTAAANMVWTWKYNLAYNGGTGQHGAHLNYLQWGSLDVDKPNCVIQFNTSYQSAEQNSGGEGYQGYCNSGVPAPGGDFSYNTEVFSPLGSGIAHLVGGKGWTAHANYIDKKGNAGYFYNEANPGPTGNRYFGNFDLTTGNTVAL